MIAIVKDVIDINTNERTTGDSWEMHDSSDEEVCDNCDKEFSYERQIEVTYNSYANDVEEGD